MALLRSGRCCSRRQGGCLQHRTEAQPRPKGQDAGGTPALPGDAVGGAWRATSQKADVHPRQIRRPGAGMIGLMRLWGHLSRRWEHPRQWLLRLAFRVPHSRQRMYMTWVNQWVMAALPPSMSTTSRTLIAVSITGGLTTGVGYRGPCGRCAATFTVAGPGRKSRANSTKTTAAAPAGTSHI